MSVSLVARGLTIAHGAHVVLDDVSLTVAPHARIGVVGPNGAGKSTLLRALAGIEGLDHGSVERQPAAATIGYLSQELDRRPGETVREFVGRRTGVAAAERELEEAAAALVEGTDAVADRFDVALARHTNLGAADLEARLAVTADDLGLSAAVLARSTAALSGGETARVGLAALLLSRFDVVLLDEPTNDLDLDGLARLEAHIVGTDQSVVLVSHDRAFLERTITSVAEIDAHDGSLQVFNGGWTAYQELAATARRHADDDYATYRDQRDRLQQRAATERSWSDKGVRRAKASGEQDKFIRHNNTSSSEHVAARARRTERAAERLDVIEKPWESWELRLTFTEAPRSGASVARLDRAVVARGEFALGPIDLEIIAGERVVLLGANGAGKSTLLAALLGEVELTSGRRSIGPSVQVGVLDQRRGVLAASDKNLERAFVDATGLDRNEARSLLAKFGLGADHVERTVDQLSPGERTRAELARFVAVGVNTLVFDEPTNHLDLEGIEQVEAALATFSGTVIIVSHDRRFLDNVAATRTLELSHGQLVDRR